MRLRNIQIKNGQILLLKRSSTSFLTCSIHEKYFLTWPYNKYKKFNHIYERVYLNAPINGGGTVA